MGQKMPQPSPLTNRQSQGKTEKGVNPNPPAGIQKPAPPPPPPPPPSNK